MSTTARRVKLLRSSGSGCRRGTMIRSLPPEPGRDNAHWQTTGSGVDERLEADCVVVGSGPSGVACTTALLDAGRQVLMVDPGVTLEDERQKAVEQLARLDVDEWQGHRIAFLTEGVVASTHGIPLKLAYGSDYPYRPTDTASIELHDAYSSPSWAVGGLSTVWGASILPARPEDIQSWPARARRLEEHYQAALNILPFSARRDGLEDILPLYRRPDEQLRMSEQAQALLTDIERSGRSPRPSGIWSGASRLAVRATSSPGGPGCVRCGLCLYGCPHRLIYSSDQTIRQLVGRPNFRARNGLTVKTFEDDADGVWLRGSTDLGGSVGIHARQVFLAAGVLGTARIVLASLGRYDADVPVQDSCYFLLPLLRYRRSKGAGREPRHALAQVLLEVLDPSISPFTVSLQVYTYCDLFKEAADRFLRMLNPLVGPIVDRLVLERLLLIQGYLHSDHTPPLALRLRAPDDAGISTLELRGTPWERTASHRVVLRRLVHKLRRERHMLKAVPAAALLRVGDQGRGFHSGGTFPMRETAGPLQTDVLGRLGGAGGVHLVDASVLPSVPATTITLTVMANAHRIGSEAAPSR